MIILCHLKSLKIIKLLKYFNFGNVDDFNNPYKDLSPEDLAALKEEMALTYYDDPVNSNLENDMNSFIPNVGSNQTWQPSLSREEIQAWSNSQDNAVIIDRIGELGIDMDSLGKF